MTNQCTRAMIWLSFICLSLFTFYFFSAESRLASVARIAPSLGWSGKSKEVNSTLGFQEIFVINLPSRTDRRDMFELMAVSAGINVKFISGVTGDDVEEVAFVEGMHREWSGAGYIGSWRSHLNVVQEILHERAATALILEDDVDWDIRLKEQVAKVLRAVQSAEFVRGWDILWLGHQGDILPPDDQRHVIIQDPTVPRDLSYGFRKAMDHFPMQTRVLHPSDYPLATFAYVLSAAGAQKVLYHVGLKNQTGCYHCAFDELLANDCRSYMNCVSLTPGLFHDFKAAGSSEKQSLNNAVGEPSRSEEMYSKNIDKSVRKHLKLSFNTRLRTNRLPLTEDQLSDRFNEVFNDERFRPPEDRG